jgi:DNA-binding IclR family transcriptional regulator
METLSPTPTVPALARGLSAMRLLADEGPLAMEAVASRLALPRSSVFRLLETLRSLGYAERDPSRRYRLVWSFHPGEGASAAFAARLNACMERLADSLGVTIEWYEATERGLELRRQRLPVRGEVRVAARPGFIRLWNTEFDAVARLGHAFSPTAPSLKSGLHLWKRDGHASKIPLREARELTAAALKTRTAADTFFNHNGVRRAGSAVLLPGGLPAGFLIAAASLTFAPDAPTPARIVSALRSACDDLSR